MLSTGVFVITFVTTAIGLFDFVTNALELGPTGRREILQQGGAAFAVAATGAAPGAWASSPLEGGEEDLRQIFRSLSPAKKKDQFAPQPSRPIEWSPTSKDFSNMRYSTSSLSTKETLVPEPSIKTLPYLPSWIEGHWLITYKFDGVSFPNGRDKVSLVLPGAGLGTCAALPNVGVNPSPFVQRFGNGSLFESNDDDNDNGPGEPFVVEDVAYNLPRKFEGFWPEAKVSSVRVSTSATNTNMGPACHITGEGCSRKENPDLHGRYATRCQMEFQGPTRRGGLRTQHLDLSMVDYSSTSTMNTPVSGNSNDEEFLMARSFVQYNQEQELTSYYREFVSYEKEQSKLPNGKLKGRTCVAAFLPSSQQAVAVYKYSMKMYAITAEEATMY